MIRKDYVQVSGTSKGVLFLVQSSQNVIIGDQAGSLTMYALATSMIPVWTISMRSISHIEVANDIIFVSSGCYVYSYSFAGKELGNFDTNVAEAIKTFKVKGNEIWTVGKYLYNHYANQKEVDYLILQDTINDLCIGSVSGDLVNNAILALNDKSIRVILGTETVYTVLLTASPTCLQMYGAGRLLYGTNSGSLGLIRVEREQGSLLWNVQEKTCEVSCISSFEMYESGVLNIILSRSDGNIEVYVWNISTNEVELKSEIFINEGITSMMIGKINGQSEIVLSTFSGKIIGIMDTSKQSDFNLTNSLNSEISNLKQKLEDTKRQYNSGFSQPIVQTVSKITHKLSLIGEQAAYCLIIESQFPIDSILIQAEMPIELLDNDSHEASITTSEDDDQTLVTYRYSDLSHTRSQLLFRNSEGQPGNLNIYVLPCLDPKIAQQITVEIKPLSLHEKVMSLNTSDRPLNTLKMTGSFSKNEMHGWISQSLPDVPPNAQDDVIILYYSSCVIGSILVVSYSGGWAEFRSDSVSVLAILKESILKIANFRKIHVNCTFSEAPDSCEYVIKLIEVHIAELQELETKFQLIEALKEIEIQGDIEKFGEEFVSILSEAENIKVQYKKYPKKLQFFQGIVSDLYVDYCKFRGAMNFSDRIPHLQSLLANFDCETLVAFFKQ